MDLHEAALNDLLSLARQRGGLTMEDLRKALPVDSMTVEDLSHVLARLDRAGLDVEVDPTLLLPDNKTPAQGVAPVAKRDEPEVSELMPEGRQVQISVPGSAGAPVLKNHTVWHSNSPTSAPMLPWILAFAIVVLAVFAAFAF